MKLLGDRYDLAVEVLSCGFRDFESVQAGLNKIYVLGQPVVRLNYDQTLVHRLDPDAAVEEYLALVEERVSTVSLALVPLEPDFLLRVGPYRLFRALMSRMMP